MSAYDGYNPNGYTRPEITDEYEPGDPKAFDVAAAEEQLEVCS